MTHHSIGYKNTTQRDTELEFATQWDKSLKEEIHLLKYKSF